MRMENFLPLKVTNADQNTLRGWANPGCTSGARNGAVSVWSESVAVATENEHDNK